jgi:hypothetical protein
MKIWKRKAACRAAVIGQKEAVAPKKQKHEPGGDVPIPRLGGNWIPYDKSQRQNAPCR